MTIMLIDNPVDTATLVASSAAALMPVDNIKEPERSKKWRSGAVTKSWLDITFGAEEARTFAALLDLNLTSGGTIRLQSWGAALDKHEIKSSQGHAFTFTRANATATRFNRAGKVEACVADSPRFVYNPVTLACKGLLIEEPRTNIITQSRNFAAGSWSPSDTSVVAGAVNSPYGTLGGTKVREGTTPGAEHYVGGYSTSMVAGVAWTFTVSAKAGERKIIAVRMYSGSGWAVGAPIAYFNLSTGVITVVSGGTAKIVPEGDGWYRCSITAETNVTTNVGALFNVCDDAGQLFYTGDGTSGLYVDAAQWEQGVCPTSAIHTAGSTVARSLDLPTINTSAIAGFSATEGSMFCEFELTQTANSPGLWALIGGALNGDERISAFIYSANGNIYEEVRDNNTDQVGLQHGAVSLDTISRNAQAWKLNDFAATLNGGAASTDNAGTLPTLTTLVLGMLTSAGQTPINGYLRKLHYYNTRLSNADLQTLSGGGVIATQPTMTLDFTAEPGADITVNPTLYAAAVAQANYGGGGYGQGNYGSTVVESQLDARNLTIIDFGQSYPQKYWRVTLEDTNTSYQELARLYLTTPVEFTYNVSWGWRLSRVENSAAKKAIGGQRYVQQRDSQLRIDGDFDYLTDNERSDMAVRLFEIGERTPIIFSIYPEATRRGLTTTLYGHFEDASFAHASHDINRFPFSVIEDL